MEGVVYISKHQKIEIMTGTEAFVAFFALLVTHGLVFGLFFIFMRNRHRERMTMLEKGIDAALLVKKPESTRANALKYGLLLMGLSLGLLVAFFIDLSIPSHIPEPPLYFGGIFLFGGLGLLAYYLIMEKRDAKKAK